MIMPLRWCAECFALPRAGFYEWLREPVCDRAKEDVRFNLISDSYVASHGVYGARRVFGDLREAGESCGLHRVERSCANTKSRLYVVIRHRARSQVALPSLRLIICSGPVNAPNTVWVTDITYIRTWQGWLYLAVVVDLYARKVVG
jgi:putative transposase